MVVGEDGLADARIFQEVSAACDSGVVDDSWVYHADGRSVHVVCGFLSDIWFVGDECSDGSTGKIGDRTHRRGKVIDRGSIFVEHFLERR